MKKSKKKKIVTQKEYHKISVQVLQKFKNCLSRLKALKDKFSKTHGMKSIVFLFAGFSSILIGIVLFVTPTWEEDFGGLTEAEKYGPIIQIACDKASQPLTVTVVADKSGKIELYFIHRDVTHMDGDVNFWILIQDASAPFTWKIEKGAEAMSVYASNNRTYLSEVRDKTLGKEEMVWFRLNLKKGLISDNKITLQLEKDNYCVKDKDECWVRLPHVFPWYSYNADINFITSDSESMENPKIIDKTMNGDILYAPSLQISTYMENLAFENPNLSVKSFYPQGLYQEAYVMWREQMIFRPEIKYVNLNWQDELELYETFAGLFLGFGLSFLTIGFKSIKKGKRILC